VPLAFRVLYAFLHREGMRKGEARSLEWPDAAGAREALVEVDWAIPEVAAAITAAERGSSSASDDPRSDV